MDGLNQILGIAGLGHITLGANLDGAHGEYRIIVHAEHDDTSRRIAPEQSPRQFKPRHRRQVDIEHADVRMPFTEHALTALRVGGFHDVDLGIVRKQGTAPRSNDTMIINDQNAHWHWSRIPASSPLLHRIWRNTGTDFGAITAVDGHEIRTMLLYASIG